MMAQRLRLAAVAAAMTASWAGSARLAAAADPRVALIWVAPAGCPTTEAIQDEVEKSLVGSPKEVAPVAAAVNVIAPAQGVWRASLVVHSHGKRAGREFEAELRRARGGGGADHRSTYRHRP